MAANPSFGAPGPGETREPASTPKKVFGGFFWANAAKIRCQKEGL